MGKKILGYFLVTLLFSIIGAIILTPSAPKGAKSMASDPYLDGGEWNISFSNGMSFEDATCIMWNQNINHPRGRAPGFGEQPDSD